MTKQRIAVASVVKNAGPKFAEWIAYQFAVGFDAVLILDNNSTDETADIARRFAETYDVRIEPWTATTPDYQTKGYDHLVGAMAAEFDWCACIDCDEFVVLPENRSLQDLVAVPEDISGIAMPWAFFGSNGHETSPSDLVIRSFTKRAEPAFGPNRQIKSIIRPSRFTRCANVHVYEMPGSYMDMTHKRYDGMGVAIGHEPDYTGGKLHHYFVQSRADWAAKLSRGYHDTTRALTEFEAYDRNEIVDEGALRHADGVDTILRAVGY